MEMGKKIHELRMQKGMTLEELGNIVGVGKSTVRKWENGIIANMKRDKILKVSVALGVSPAYLMGWQESTDEEIISLNNVHPIELKRFPMLGDIACGVPKYTNEDRESYVMAGTNINADFCLRASGDSMVGARILDGDIVFIRKQDMVENGEIAAVVVNNDSEATLKRLYYYPDKGLLILKPENPAYEDLIFSGNELNQVHVLGKAMAFQSDVK
jgi:repressor LexA